MTKYIFPILLICLQFWAAVVYAVFRDWRMAIYWLAATILNIMVTIGG